MVFTSYSNIISSLGFTTLENYGAVCNGEKALQKILFPFSKDAFCVSQIENDILKEKAADLKNPLSHTKLELLSILSIKNVLDESGVNPQDPRTLLIYSTTKGNIDILEGAYKTVYKERIYLPAFAIHLQHYFKLQNTPVVLSNACISGLLAIIMAKRFIENGLYDHVIVCGGDIVSEFTLSGFKSFNALSNEPCKPFDANRSGVNLGEAVATILITRDQNLATYYETEILAGSSANDANHISGPSRTGDGLFQCLEQTLKNQNLSETGFISAHGTATPFNDEMESIAFERAALTKVPVNSLKGYYGHTLGAAGVLETVLSLESMKHQKLIKSEGYETIGVSGNICMIESPEEKSFTSFIKTASGFGGCNAAAFFKKFNDLK